MQIIAKTEQSSIAHVYVAKMGENKLIEFVESLDPLMPREEKWILIISTLYGCPVKCKFCDAGDFYKGKLSKEELLAQIEYAIKEYYPDGHVPTKKFKIQFARMGDPAFNFAVLDALEAIPTTFDVPGFLPSISSIAPRGTEEWFERLMEIKNRMYPLFQMQFSIHTTNTEQRDWLIPVKKWSFKEMADYGERFFRDGDRKLTLNFALADNMELSADTLFEYFDPNKYLVKITPVNPTYRAMKNNLDNAIKSEHDIDYIIESLTKRGYDSIISIGEIEENNIGSNCGQHIINYMNGNMKVDNSYTYKLKEKC